MPDREDVNLARPGSSGRSIIIGENEYRLDLNADDTAKSVRDINSAVSRIVEEERNKAIDQTRIECHKNFEGVAEALAKDAAVKALEGAVEIYEKWKKLDGNYEDIIDDIRALADRYRGDDLK